jgi:hypothetical protein
MMTIPMPQSSGNFPAGRVWGKVMCPRTEIPAVQVGAIRLAQLESSPAQIQFLTGFDWIVNVGLNAK